MVSALTNLYHPNFYDQRFFFLLVDQDAPRQDHVIVPPIPKIRRTNHGQEGPQGRADHYRNGISQDLRF
jgi:hypothetical protein